VPITPPWFFSWLFGCFFLGCLLRLHLPSSSRFQIFFRPRPFNGTVFLVITIPTPPIFRAHEVFLLGILSRTCVLRVPPDMDMTLLSASFGPFPATHACPPHRVMTQLRILLSRRGLFFPLAPFFFPFRGLRPPRLVRPIEACFSEESPKAFIFYSRLTSKCCNGFFLPSGFVPPRADSCSPEMGSESCALMLQGVCRYLFFSFFSYSGGGVFPSGCPLGLFSRLPLTCFQ